MQGPKILRLQSQRLARATLGHDVLANLFHREGMSRKKVPITGRLAAPMAGDSRGHFGLMSFVTGPEKRTCVLTQRQQIQWPLDQDLLPGRRTSRNILRNPGTQGFLVQTLPGIGRQSLRQQQVCPCLGVGVERTFGHERVALEYMSKDKLRKLLQQRVQAILHPKAVVVNVVDQGVESLNRCGTGRAEREAPDIDDVSLRHGL